jgi:hypothetical protein
MSPYPGSNIQDARFLPAVETVVDKGLLFGPQIEEITARAHHSWTVDNPHVKSHITIWLPQLVKHCLRKSTHMVVELVRLRSRLIVPVNGNPGLELNGRQHPSQQFS